MRLTWGAFYAFLFMYRSIFSVLGQTLVLRFTSIPDTHSYQSKSIGYLLIGSNELNLDVALAMQQQANVITGMMGALLGFVTGGNAILINLGFQTLAFIGIWRMLDATPIDTRRYLALLVMFPSFTMWSSIASKEAIVVFLVGMLSRLLIDMYKGTGKFGLRHAFFLAVLYVFKPHFVPAILFLMAVPLVAGRIRQPAAIALLAGIASLVPLYLLRYRVDDYILRVVRGVYSEPGGSTRAEPYLAEQFDFFAKAPGGMLRAFIGPTFGEASAGPLHFVSFAESIILLAMLLFFVVPRLPRMPAYVAIVTFFAIFWVMMPNYPLGIANPGTAVRYRTDWLLLIYLAAIVLTSRDLFFNWRSLRQTRAQNFAGS